MGSLHQVMKVIRTILCLALAWTASAASLNEGTRFWNWCWWCSTGISEDLNDLDLILYTYGNPSWTFKLDADSQDLLSNGFDVNKPTKLLSHGYTDNGPRFCSDFVQAYENDPNETFNIICIDWQILAKADEPEFSGAANNAIKVGKAVGEKVVAKMLIEGLGQNPDKIHAIGHSMGGQVVGNVGKAAYEFSNQKIARVTGLDVAQQYFDSHLSEDTIRPDDAKLVDIMHTDSGDVGAAASTMDPIGMVDFYPNGGGMMAGCEWSFWASACNHMKTLDYYVDSVINRKNPDYMASTKCESYEEFQAGNCDQMEKLPMGEALTLDMVSGNGPMKFYLNTNANYPFGQ